MESIPRWSHGALLRCSLLLLLCALCVFVVQSLAFSAQQAGTWRDLFDGKTLAGWKATGNAEGWAVEEGAIVCKARGGGYLYTEEQFDNFVLSIDYKVSRGANSGVFFRWSNLRDPVDTGIEMQVYDSHGKERPGKHDDGAIYDLVAPRTNRSRPAGEWNTAVITCDDSKITVALNGETVAEMDVNRWTEAGRNPDGTRNKFRTAYKEMARRGHIGLQDHGDVVWFRNIKVRTPVKRGE
jgi:hypothetical protein